MENIYSKKAVVETLGRYSVAPLKKLGQNFLIAEDIVEKIAEAAVEDGGNVIEIGPGLGALTRKLAARAKKVVAVDIDAGMVRILKDTLKDCGNVEIVHEDILKCDIRQLGEASFGGKFSIAGNLPYYITAKCILRALECGAPVVRFTAMVQNEVAYRLCCEPGDEEYGALTASVRYYGRMERLFGVSSACFYPKPDVESAVVGISPSACFDIPRQDYSRTVRMMFAMRRKTLGNNLKSGLGISAAAAGQLLEKAGLDPSARAETLEPENFAVLARIIAQQ